MFQIWKSPFGGHPGLVLSDAHQRRLFYACRLADEFGLNGRRRYKTKNIDVEVYQLIERQERQRRVRHAPTRTRPGSVWISNPVNPARTPGIDNRFYECAAAAQADFIVTGNTQHFPGAHGPHLEDVFCCRGACCNGRSQLGLDHKDWCPPTPRGLNRDLLSPPSRKFAGQQHTPLIKLHRRTAVSLTRARILFRSEIQ